MGKMKEIAMTQVESQFNDLFSYPHRPGHAHGSSTSKAAAVSMIPTAGTLRDKVLASLTARPQTVHEVAEALGETVPAVQPRFSELVRLKKIEDSGLTRANKSGRRAAVWRATCFV